MEDENRDVIQAFDAMWGGVELSANNRVGPAVSPEAVANAASDLKAFEAHIDASADEYKYRFFLVSDGIKILSHRKAQRELHLSLVAYTIFVITLKR